MSFGINVILFISMFPVYPIMYYVMKSQIQEKDSLLYGVRVPIHHRQDEEIIAICKKYKTMNKWIAVFLFFIPFIPFFVPYFSIQYSIYMMWLLAVIFLFSLPYVLGNRAMKQWKAAHRDRESEGICKSTLDEEEDNWVWGMFYYNPKDSKTMVEKRFGIGTTMNMAKPVSKFIMVFVGIALLAMPASCVWIALEEFTPIHLEVQQNTLVATHIRTEYEIDLQKVETVSLITKLPHTYKKNGSGMENLEKGTFKVDGYGDCQLFLNPNNHQFIVLTSADKTYFFSEKTDEETLVLYEDIKNVLGK